MCLQVCKRGTSLHYPALGYRLTDALHCKRALGPNTKCHATDFFPHIQDKAVSVGLLPLPSSLCPPLSPVMWFGLAKITAHVELGTFTLTSQRPLFPILEERMLTLGKYGRIDPAGCVKNVASFTHTVEVRRRGTGEAEERLIPPHCEAIYRDTTEGPLPANFSSSSEH